MSIPTSQIVLQAKKVNELLEKIDEIKKSIQTLEDQLKEKKMSNTRELETTKTRQELEAKTNKMLELIQSQINKLREEELSLSKKIQSTIQKSVQNYLSSDKFKNFINRIFFKKKRKF